MKPKHLLQKLDHRALEAAIAGAERLTSGEIRVVVAKKAAPDAIAAAQAMFRQLGMEKTRERNAVLFFLAPASQTFAVLGDEGVHRECGQEFWEATAAAMAGAFQQGDFTAGLLAGIARAGELLGARFPRQPDDRNELPDTVVET